METQNALDYACEKKHPGGGGDASSFTRNGLNARAYERAARALKNLFVEEAKKPKTSKSMGNDRTASSSENRGVNKHRIFSLNQSSRGSRRAERLKKDGACLTYTGRQPDFTRIGSRPMVRPNKQRRVKKKKKKQR